MRFTPAEFEHAFAIVRDHVPPTPQQRWPLLEARVGAEVWVKHENHGPVGAFKLRGGLVHLARLRASTEAPSIRGLVSATRGNHGQSLAFAGRVAGWPVTIVVPHGNSRGKNAAMRALGATLVEHGDDFQAAREHAAALAAEQASRFVPSFHRDLVLGVATYWVEFFRAVQPEMVFVPIGLGSGFAAAAAARAHCGVHTKLVGVVSAHAPAYLESWRAGRVIERPAATVLADGMACRVPEPEALAILAAEAEDVVAVTDAEVADAMRALFEDTHNVAEGAGAASLAAAMQPAARERWRGRRVGVTLCGGNVDSDLFARVLAGERFTSAGAMIAAG
jgi:threonine dehydratase